MQQKNGKDYPTQESTRMGEHEESFNRRAHENKITKEAIEEWTMMTYSYEGDVDLEITPHTLPS